MGYVFKQLFPNLEKLRSKHLKNFRDKFDPSGSHWNTTVLKSALGGDTCSTFLITANQIHHVPIHKLKLHLSCILAWPFILPWSSMDHFPDHPLAPNTCMVCVKQCVPGTGKYSVLNRCGPDSDLPKMVIIMDGMKVVSGRPNEVGTLSRTTGFGLEVGVDSEKLLWHQRMTPWKRNRRSCHLKRGTSTSLSLICANTKDYLCTPRMNIGASCLRNDRIKLQRLWFGDFLQNAEYSWYF